LNFYISSLREKYNHIDSSWWRNNINEYNMLFSFYSEAIEVSIFLSFEAFNNCVFITGYCQ